jgi:hypothetical protein
VNSDREIRARLQIGERRLADEMDRSCRKARNLRKITQKHIERPAKLILRRTADRDIRQLGLDAGAV